MGVLSGAAEGHAKEQPVLPQQCGGPAGRHQVHLPVHPNGGEEVAHPEHILSQLFTDALRRSDGGEHAVGVLVAQGNDLLFSG